MNAEAIIGILAAEGKFNTRRLSFHFPLGVMNHLSRGPRFFLSLLTHGSGTLSLDQLIDDAWRKDPVALNAYHGLSAEERLEVHTIIGFVLHETTHKVDLLVSPFASCSTDSGSVSTAKAAVAVVVRRL